MKTVKMLKEWEKDGVTFGEGKILKISDDEAVAQLVKDGIAEEYDAEAVKELEKQKKEAEDHQKALISAAVKESLAAIFSDTAKISVVEPEKDKKGGFKSFGHFVHDIYKAGPDGRGASKELIAYDHHVKQTMVEGEDASGGYLVPEEFMATLLQTSLEMSIIKPRATFLPLRGNSVAIPALVDETHATDEYFGGVTIHRTEETGQKTKSRPKFRMVRLTLHKVTGLAEVSDELLEDSAIAIEPILNKVFGQAIAFVEDDDYINGNGVGKPVGMLNAKNGALVVQAKKSGQAADTVVAENTLAMYARMPAALISNAIWIASSTILVQLGTMSIGNMPVFMPPGGLTAKPHAMLLGRPLFFSEKVAVLGDQGDLNFVAPSEYLIAGKPGGEIKTASSIHLRFDFDETVFRFVLRYDGTPWWRTYLTPKKGDTKSPFVTLEART